jgi:hypothetical protein
MYYSSYHSCFAFFSSIKKPAIIFRGLAFPR